jgi:non-ribosomal peptide synthetase component E (peptide arylation enzyme)
MSERRRSESLWQLVEARAAATPEALFAVDESDRTLTFAAYRDAALRTAAGLYARGIAAETPVSWMLPTTLEALVLAAALARLGAVQNPILPIYRERETRFVTGQTKAQLLCVPPPFRGFDYPALARALAAERAVQGGRPGRPTRSEPQAS